MITKPATQVVPYNLLLLTTLEDQHQAMMLKFKSVLNFAKRKQFQQLNVSLGEFADMVKEHWRCERELYLYLELVVSRSDGTYHDTRAEMRDIALLINSKLNLHINQPITKETLKIFKNDFALLGKALLGRMRFEEKHLFDDYSNHDA